MKPFKISELRRRMVYIAEQTLATPKGGEAFEALQCEIENIVRERDARIAELEAAIDSMDKAEGHFGFSQKRAALMSIRNRKGELAK